MVEPHQVHGSVGPVDPQTLGPRVLELSNLMQTSLELEKQVGIFSKAMQEHLNIDGLEYENDAFPEKLQTGNTATHRATYELKLDEESLGRMRIYREIPFTNKEIALLENLLCAVIYPMKNALSYREALMLASHDPLTGVQNRLAFDSALQRESDLAVRQDAPLSLLVIDADHFKHFNDEYGHSFGDDVLKALASAAATTIRRSDLLYRIGGEEFVVLAAHTTTEGGALLAERVRQAVAGISMVAGRKIAMSVSVGVTQLRAGESPREFFERADDAMYQAKQSGRNRVVTV